MIRLLLLAGPLLAAAACTGGDGAYPSLAMRPVESRSFDEPSRPQPVASADPALDRMVAELETRLRQVTGGFDEAAGQAERRAAEARGRPAGSEPWLEAQTALAALDDWRSQASSLTTDVEQAAIARAATLAAPYPSLTALGDRAEAEARRQGETIARLQAMLAPA